MKTIAKSAEIFEPVGLQNLQDGEYIGRWSGDQATVIIEGFQYRLKTKDGIRAINAKCIVRIGGGSVTVESI